MTESSRIPSLGNSYNVTRLGVDLLNTAFFKTWLDNTFFRATYCIHFKFIQVYVQVQI